MPGPFDPLDLLPAVPVIGNIAQAAIQRGQSIRDIKYQNEYNTPKNQLERLKEAGLPAAAMLGGSYVNAQTDIPRTTELDPTLGTAQGLEQFMKNRFQKEQIKTLQQERDLRDSTIQKARAEARLAGAFADTMLNKIDDNQPTSDKTGVQRKAEADIKESEASAFLRDQEGALKSIQYEVDSKSADDRVSIIANKLTNIIASNDRLRQLIDLDKAKQTVTQSLNEYLKGDNANGFMAWISALLLKMMK